MDFNMKLVTKTPKKVVLEIAESQIKELGFDIMWDKVRNLYPFSKYEIFQIVPDKENLKTIFVELLKKEPV